MTPEKLIPETLAWKNEFVRLKQRYDLVGQWCRGLEVLDAACGVGYGSKILAEAGASQVVGAHKSEMAIRLSSMRVEHPQLKFIRVDLDRPQTLDSRFDVVVSFDTLEHLADPERFIGGARQLLRPDGLFVCSTRNKDYWGSTYSENPYALSELTFGEFAALFERHFFIRERYHQSPSLAYARHRLLVRELEDVQFQLMSSKLIGIESAVRKAFGRNDWEEPSFSSDLWRAVPGDYIIEAFSEPSPHHQDYILTGVPRNAE